MKTNNTLENNNTYEPSIIYTISPAVINKICPNKEIMIYGYDHCHYCEVGEAFEAHDIKVYDHEVGDDVDPDSQKECHRIDGSKINQINAGLKDISSSSKELVRVCKAGLVNMVLENYKSQLIGKSQVPIIFCVDMNNNHHPLSSEDITSKNKIVKKKNGDEFKANEIITHCELRRAYKLCNDPRIDPRIRAIAKKSIKFFKVEKNQISSNKNESGQSKKNIILFDLKLIQAPWEAKDWDIHWNQRKSLSVANPQKKEHDWRGEIQKFILRTEPSFDHFRAKL